MSISGNSSVKLHCGNVVTMPYYKRAFQIVCTIIHLGGHSNGMVGSPNTWGSMPAISTYTFRKYSICNMHIASHNLTSCCRCKKESMDLSFRLSKNNASPRKQLRHWQNIIHPRSSSSYDTN